MKKMMIVCGLVIGLPLTVLANDMIEQELNGLNIDVQVVGSSNGSGPGPGNSGGPQVLKVTNNSSSVASCELQPGPSEAMEKSAAVTIKPGKDASLPLEGSYSSASPHGKLVCTPK